MTVEKDPGSKYEWRCKDCTAARPGDRSGYMSIIRHTPAGQKHHVHLIDKSTGDEVATNLPQAQAKGIIPFTKDDKPAVTKIPPAPVTPTVKTEPVVETPATSVAEEEPETPAGEEEKASSEEPETPPTPKAFPLKIGEDGISVTLSFPPLVYTQFDMAKRAGLITDLDMDFNAWVFECIQKRFELDYKLVAVFVSPEAIEQMKKMEEQGDGRKT